MMFDAYSALWICCIVAFGLTALLHSLRQQTRRRDSHLYEIPPFLRGTSDPGDNAKTDWIEIHPAPGRRKR